MYIWYDPKPGLGLQLPWKRKHCLSGFWKKFCKLYQSKRPNKFLTVRFPRPAPRHSWKEGCDQSFLFFVRSVLCLLPLLPCLVLLDPGGRVGKTLHQSQWYLRAHMSFLIWVCGTNFNSQIQYIDILCTYIYIYIYNSATVSRTRWTQPRKHLPGKIDGWGRLQNAPRTSWNLPGSGNWFANSFAGMGCVSYVLVSWPVLHHPEEVGREKLLAHVWRSETKGNNLPGRSVTLVIACCFANKHHLEWVNPLVQPSLRTELSYLKVFMTLKFHIWLFLAESYINVLSENWHSECCVSEQTLAM